MHYEFVHPRTNRRENDLHDKKFPVSKIHVGYARLSAAKKKIKIYL